MPNTTTGTIFTAAFWRDAGERTVRTFAEAAAAFLAANATGLLETDLAQALSVSGLAALVALLLCIASGTAAPTSGASMGTTTPKTGLPGPVAPARYDDGTV